MAVARAMIALGEADAFAQGQVAEGGGDDAGAGQQPEVDIHLAVQVVTPAEQIPGRLALRDQQGQYVLVGACRFRSGRWPGQKTVDFVEIQVEPGLQALCQTVHFAEAGGGGKGNAIEVVHHDALAGHAGVGAVQIGAQAGGGYLAQLVRGGKRQPVGRVAVLFDLGGQG